MINITGCHRCQPEKWKQVGPSVGIYWCVKCRKAVRQILERRKKNDLYS
jgi:hypothetical protein